MSRRLSDAASSAPSREHSQSEPNTYTPTQITSPIPTIVPEELNLLVWLYLKESGFGATAFSFSKENTNLNQLQKLTKTVPARQLQNIVQDGLRYNAIKAHVQNSPQSLQCRSPFSLLQKHQCSIPAAHNFAMRASPLRPSNRPSISMGPPPLPAHAVSRSDGSGTKGKGRSNSGSGTVQAGHSPFSPHQNPASPPNPPAVQPARPAPPRKIGDLIHVSSSPTSSELVVDAGMVSLPGNETMSHKMWQFVPHSPPGVTVSGGKPISSPTVSPTHPPPRSPFTVPPEEEHEMQIEMSAPPPPPPPDPRVITRGGEPGPSALRTRPPPLQDMQVDPRPSSPMRANAIAGPSWTVLTEPEPPSPSRCLLRESKQPTHEIPKRSPPRGAATLMDVDIRTDVSVSNPKRPRFAVPSLERDRSTSYSPKTFAHQVDRHLKGVRCLPFHEDEIVSSQNQCEGKWCGNLWVTGYFDGQMKIWEIPEDISQPAAHTTGAIADPSGNAVPVDCLSWTESAGETSLLVAAGHTISVCPPSPGSPWKISPSRRLLTHHLGQIYEVKVSPDGQRALTASADGTAGLWHLPDSSLVRRYSPPHGGRSPNKQYHDLTSGVSISGVEWLDNTTFMISRLTQDHNIWMYSIDDGSACKLFRGHEHNVFGTQATPARQGLPRRLASMSSDCTARTWELEGGHTEAKPMAIMRGHQKAVTCIQWFECPTEGQDYPFKLATGSDDCTVRIWDPISGACLRNFAGHTQRVMSLSLTPGGGTIVEAAGDNRVRFLDTKTMTFVGHMDLTLGEDEDARSGRWIVNAAGQSDATGRLRWVAAFFSTGESCVVDITRTVHNLAP